MIVPGIIVKHVSVSRGVGANGYVHNIVIMRRKTKYAIVGVVRRKGVRG